MTLTLRDLPKVRFAEKDVNKILNDMIKGFEQAHYEATGDKMKLYPGDPRRIFLYSQALRELQLRVLIDDGAKQNLLAYSRGDSLEHLGAFTRTQRLEPKPAVVTMNFVLSEAQGLDQTIPAGTRVSPDRALYFETTESHTVPAGDTEIEFVVQCKEDGEIGNDYAPGQVDILVDPLPWIDYVENIDTSSGGADREDDESYRERIHLAPGRLSLAGPEAAYVSLTKDYSALITDVQVVSPTPGYVDVYVILNGDLPEQAFLNDLLAFLSAKDKRPLTDSVDTKAPSEVAYDLDVTYYIKEENVDNEAGIMERVVEAIDDWVLWQRDKIGRGVNPSVLTARCIEAGAKRVDVNAPSYASLEATELAVINNKTVNYGGLE